MIEDINIFKKIKQDCSSIFLLDENLCLSNSYQIINYNIQNLSSALISLQPTIDYFNNQYTYFTENSSKILEVNQNLKNKTEKLNNIFTLTFSNSSFFNKVFYVSYSSPLNIIDWNFNINSDPTYYQNSNYAENQNIVVNVILYFEQEFNLSNNGTGGTVTPNNLNINSGFYREHLEECRPEKGTPIIIGCGSGSCSIPSRGCNHHSKNQTYCFNAYEQCGKRASGGGAASGSCSGTGSKTLKIQDNFNTKDRYTTTSINLVYENINSIWVYTKILT